MKKFTQHLCSVCFSAVFLMLIITTQVWATDLMLYGYTDCETSSGYMTYFKTIVDNTSQEGGGPFDSEETIVEIEQNPFEIQEPKMGIVSGQIFGPNGHDELVTDLSAGIGAKMNPLPGQCIVNGQTTICNLGRVPAGETRTLRLYYVAQSPGEITLETRVRGNLFDPNPQNNNMQTTLTILPKTFRLVYPWISNNQGQFESILVANNYSDAETDVNLTARRADGSSQTVQRTIPAKASLIETASSLFPQLGSGSGYCVVIESSERRLSGHWVTNNLLTGTGRSPSQGVAIDNLDGPDPFGDHFGRRIMFGYLPIQGDLTSAPVIVNLGEQAANVVLRFFDQAGNLVLEDRDTLRGLQPLRPFAAVANTLVPQGSDDLYLVASSDQPLTGVAFVFNSLGEPAIGNAVGIPETN